MFRTGAKHSSSPASFQGPGTRYVEMFAQAGGYPGDLVFLHDLATYTWRSSFRHAGYFGDLMLLHDTATSTCSCSFRLLGAVEIFPAVCSGRRTGAKHSSSPASFQGPGTRYMEMFVQAGGIPWRSCVCSSMILRHILGDPRSGLLGTLEILCSFMILRHLLGVARSGSWVQWRSSQPFAQAEE